MAEDGAEGTTEDRKRNVNKMKSWKIGEIKVKRFKLRSRKARLADDKTLDIAGVGDVILKTSFDTSWTLKDVRDQQWKVTKGSLVVARGNKRGSLYMVEDWYEHVSFQRQQSRCTKGLRIPKEEWRGKDTSLAHLKAAAQMKYDTDFGIRRVTRLSETEILHLWTRFIEPENDSIVAEHGLSSKIPQILGESSDTSEGSENSVSFEENRRSDEEYSEDGASSKEGGSETPRVRRSTRESGAPVRETKSSIHLVKNLKICSGAKLVRILISEWSLSLLKILRTNVLKIAPKAHLLPKSLKAPAFRIFLDRGLQHAQILEKS
uniref:Retrovirus-related Pol polyprotein from transposon TNT 1-94 n=1 Tax=Tanacetum cinerariifolium TaxID=118510 RepID=A0A699IJN9_TANCI|nr:retrovirus-related Pol polyprotein from transposon TNT 1-94 [Tanacetum cinerariifolium]